MTVAGSKAGLDIRRGGLVITAQTPSLGALERVETLHSAGNGGDDLGGRRGCAARTDPFAGQLRAPIPARSMETLSLALIDTGKLGHTRAGQRACRADQVPR